MKQVMLIMILVIVLSGKINNREFNIIRFRFVLGLHFRCVTVTKFSDFLTLTDWGGGHIDPPL